MQHSASRRRRAAALDELDDELWLDEDELYVNVCRRMSI